MTAYILGIDPGRRSGAALLASRKGEHDPLGAWQHTSKHMSPEGFADDVLRRSRSLVMANDDPYQVPTPLYLVHEAQYIPRGSKNPGSLLAVATVSGMWRGLGALYGWQAIDDGEGYGVHPRTWRAAVDDRPHGKRYDRTGPQWEAWAVARMRVTGLECLKTHHHKAEALQIAIWGAIELAKREKADAG